MSTSGPLSLEQVHTFDEQGFLIIESVFAESEIAEMAEAFWRLTKRAAKIDETAMVEGSQFVVTDEVIHRIVWCGGCEEVLSRYGSDQRLVSIAGQLLETPRLSQLINQAHFKYPGDGVVFKWHQDSRHRRYGTDLWDDIGVRGSFLETATAIDAMTAENGPLRFIPGSHRAGHIQTDPETGDLPRESFDATDAETVIMEPGSVAIFGPYTIHSSQSNHSTSMRRLFLNGFAHPDANRRTYPGKGAGRIIDVGA